MTLWFQSSKPSPSPSPSQTMQSKPIHHMKNIKINQCIWRNAIWSDHSNIEYDSSMFNTRVLSLSAIHGNCSMLFKVFHVFQNVRKSSVCDVALLQIISFDDILIFVSFEVWQCENWKLKSEWTWFDVFRLAFIYAMPLTEWKRKKKIKKSLGPSIFHPKWTNMKFVCLFCIMYWTLFTSALNGLNEIQYQIENKNKRIKKKQRP